MTFWELASAFRSETDILKSVLGDPQWATYKTDYDDLATLISLQDRTILDSEIPNELACQVCEKSKLRFWLYYKRTPCFLTSWQQGTDEPFEEVTALDILVRFGGSVIEETLERGVAEVMPRKLDGNIEVVNVFNLSQIGMLAFLRVEADVHIIGKKIRSFDGQKEWLVIKRQLMYPSPFAAQMKMKSQEEQGIYQFVIKPLLREGKPQPGELLHIDE